MKKELFGGFAFFSIVIMGNYIIKHFLDNYNDIDDKNQDDKTQDDKTQDDKTQDDKTQDDKTQDDIVMEKMDAKNLSYHTDDIDSQEGQEGAIRLLDSVMPIVDVLEVKLNDDIVLIQQILEKKQHLINLNTRLFEIKERLHDLKNDLVK
jgi:hypothetical protein